MAYTPNRTPIDGPLGVPCSPASSWSGQYPIPVRAQPTLPSINAALRVRVRNPTAVRPRRRILASTPTGLEHHRDR
jgi:hypothetical protein